MTRFVLALAAALTASAGIAAERPNVLFILSDDHSEPHLSCAGDPNVRTPNLDKLATEGARFTRMYVTCPQCVPSRASFMTGRSPVAIGMTRFSAPLPAEVPTFPELLRAAGYHAGIVGRSFHLDGSGGMPAETRAAFDKHALRTFARRVDVLSSDNDPVGKATEFFAGVPAGKPFVLQVGFSDPHRPWTAPDRPDPAKLKLPAHFPDTPAVRSDFADYYGEVQRLDGDIGRLLDALKTTGKADNTLVVFAGDNGAALLRGKGTLFEFGIHVPMIVRWPGVTKPGTVVDDLVSGEDICPTFLEAGGAGVPKAVTGRSIVKRLRGEPAEGRTYCFAERGAHGSGLPTNTGAFDLGRCIVGKRHKLIYTALPELAYFPVDFGGMAVWKQIREAHDAGTLDPKYSAMYFPKLRPMFQLFDLEADPGELTNLAGTQESAGVERELKAALQEWMILERDYLPLPVPPAPKGKK